MQDLPSEVTEDTDVLKLSAVLFSSVGEHEGPFQGHDAPHTGQVEALRVSEGCENRDTQFNSILFI